jgi:beta-galactosidase
MHRIVFLLVLLVWRGSAAAQENWNLLPQGSFERPEMDTAWAQGFNINDNEGFTIVENDGDHWLRIENHDPKRRVDSLHAYVNLSPQIDTLTVSARLRATNLTPGTEGWHTARIALMFEGGSFGFPPVVPELAADTDWVTKTVTLKVPDGATRLNIQPALFYCTGVFEIADLSVTPHIAAPTQEGDAVLPSDLTLGWEKSQTKPVNAKRDQISLDGIWRFAPAAAESSDPPEVGWAFIRVPGDWQKHKGDRSAFVAMGGGPAWDLYDGTRVDLAWYERRVLIPEEWRHRAISLHFERVSTDAKVYVNGKACGTVGWPWGSVDVTSAVFCGRLNLIQIQVAATADAETARQFWQNAFGEVSYSPSNLETRGLTGSVYLESRSSPAQITDVFVKTSTRNQRISLEVELAGIEKAGPVEFVAEILDENGVVEKTFAASSILEGGQLQTVSLSWPWANPRLWDVGSPNLYTLQLKALGAGLDDQIDQEFGFREFWVEGRRFFLNGSEIRLRQGCFYWGPRPQVGENFWELGSTTVDKRGQAADYERSLNDADRKGYLVAEYILNANKYILDSSYRMAWQKNRDRAMERASVWMRRYRNHPSVVMWVAGFNFFGSPVDQDPRHIGRTGWDKDNARWQRLLAAGQDMFDGLRKLDPTRVYYSHAGGYTGDVYTINCYLNLIPLQEREEWLSYWAEHGTMPVSMVEFGTPMDCTFRRGHDGFTSNITSEPLLTEFATIYFGRQAYRWEEPEYRQFIKGLFRHGMLYESSENQLDDYTNMLKIQRLFRTNTWRSWRTAGLSGGQRTWSWIQEALKENNGPTLAWIAGSAGAYVAKDHHFFPEQNVEKQIVLLNDSRQTQDYQLSWAVDIEGETLKKGARKGRLAVSETLFLPIDWTTPSVLAGKTLNGSVTMSATIGETTHEDRFQFRVYGVNQASLGEIEVIDPDGMTSKMLNAMGYEVRTWEGESSLVVIGRNALQHDPSIMAGLEEWVRAGGRALIFAQDPEWMTRALGWRICPHVSRRVFPMDSPISTGMDAEDFRDWNGSSTLIESRPVYEGDYVRGNEGDQPYAGWHWGNRGGVSSAAIEKPHRSGWRPLLECEFDLAYSPLMELDLGRGRLIFCTLDLEDHVLTDPAARRIGERIIDYLLKQPSPIAQARKVVYLGGSLGAEWLNRIGVDFQRVSSLDDHTDLLMIGPEAVIDPDTIREYLEKGGKAFFLPQSSQEGWLGTSLARANALFAGSLSVPEWPEARGLSASDLRWRAHMHSPPFILTDGAEIRANGLIGRLRVGNGTAIFCQIDPDRFNADEQTYFRYTRWRSTRAVAQLLANLGASFSADLQIFHLSGSDALAQENDKQKPVESTYYHSDYREDFPMGDNPYRYYRW